KQVNTGTYTSSGTLLSQTYVLSTTGSQFNVSANDTVEIIMGAADATPWDVAHGGTGAQTLTSHGLLVGEGTAAAASVAQLAVGQTMIGAASADPVAGNPGWVLISEQTPSGTGTVTFNSIAATYRDLRIVYRGAGSGATTFAQVNMRLNN